MKQRGEIFMNMVCPYFITSDCIETYFGLEDIRRKGRAEKKVKVYYLTGVAYWNANYVVSDEP
jgi:hypothetical protein